MTSHPVLFPEPQTPRTGPLGWAEPSVRWFTQSTRPEAVQSRLNVNAWYADLPDPEGIFGARLRSEVHADHYQSLDELYVHFLLKRGNSDVRYEEGGVGPDFRVYNGGSLLACIEVASLFQQSEWTVDQARQYRLADEVNNRLAPTAGYFVDLQIEAAVRDPAPRRFVEWLRRQLDQLPQGRLLDPAASRFPNLPTAVYDEDQVRIRVRFIPIRGRAGVPDPDDRIVGITGAVGGAVQSAARLKDRISAKAGGRYDLGDSPFLVAVGIHDAFCSDDEIVDALYGGESVLVDSGTMVRRNDGLFGVDGARPAGRHSRLSAVAIIRVQTWNPGHAEVALLKNPYAARAWPGDLLTATREFGVVSSTETEFELGWKDPGTAT